MTENDYVITMYKSRGQEGPFLKFIDSRAVVENLPTSSIYSIHCPGNILSSTKFNTENLSD